jgi:hypothetical protein
MSEPNGVSSSSSNAAGAAGAAGWVDHEEAERLAALERASQAPANRPAIVKQYLPLPATNDALLRSFVQPHALPPALSDVSLYTPDALRHEIDKLEAKLGAQSGANVEGERVFLGKLQAELVRQEAPRVVDPETLHSREAVDQALGSERAFLTRHGNALAPKTRAEHENMLAALAQRREALASDARACDNAKPMVAPLLGNVQRLDFTADDLVASLKTKISLSPEQERAARATFERWHRDTCIQTGQDPTVVVSKHRFAEVKVDGTARESEELRMRLEMLEASRSSGLAALAFLDSAARGESVAAAHSRVLGANAIGRAVMATTLRND